jgi:acyl-homoserine lactone acylase PvdQ
MAGPEGERVRRWLANSPTVFRAVRQILDERDHLTVAVEVSQKECQRLRQQRDTLREEVRRLQAENARLQTDRAEAAQWLAAMMREIAARFPLTPPPA